MKAEWLDSTDKNTCLCCGQFAPKWSGAPLTPEWCERSLAMFTALGLTREDLLGKHREQIDYQAPGFSSWLQGQ